MYAAGAGTRWRPGVCCSSAWRAARSGDDRRRGPAEILHRYRHRAVGERSAGATSPASSSASFPVTAGVLGRRRVLDTEPGSPATPASDLAEGLDAVCS
jgi:hypothetical protein